jgi:hypothetical protein
MVAISVASFSTAESDVGDTIERFEVSAMGRSEDLKKLMI